MEEKSKPQYPFEIASLVRKKTFAVEAKFSQEEEDHFLRVHNHFSRFVFTVIENGKAAWANVPLEILEGLQIASRELYRQSIVNSSKTVKGEKSPAYTYRFAGGTLKGKTPVEVLLENADMSASDPYKKGKDILNKQYSWLKDSTEKNPKFAEANKKAMDAIVEAAKIPAEKLSEIDETAVSSGSPVTLVSIGTRPLMNRPAVDGKNFVYEVYVTYEPGKNYPVNVTCKNYYAPVKKRENGTLNVVVSEADPSTKITGSFDMTLEEWLGIVRVMDEVERGYYLTHVNKAFKYAEDADKARRSENGGV